MRKLTLSLLIAVAAVSTAHAATKEVRLGDNFFRPKPVEIKKGDKVKWVWEGDDIHNVALKKPGSKKIAVASEFKTKGRFTHKFGKVGTWKALCETHPSKMRMKIVVSR